MVGSRACRLSSDAGVCGVGYRGDRACSTTILINIRHEDLTLARVVGCTLGFGSYRHGCDDGVGAVGDYGESVRDRSRNEDLALAEVVGYSDGTNSYCHGRDDGVGAVGYHRDSARASARAIIPNEYLALGGVVGYTDGPSSYRHGCDDCLSTGERNDKRRCNNEE